MEKKQNSHGLFSCDFCDFNTAIKLNYDEHLLACKDVHRTALNKKEALKEYLYKCEECGFRCNKKSNYTNHISTRKHTILNVPILTDNDNDIDNDNDQISVSFSCSKCDKQYKARNSLWYHQKKCTGSKQPASDDGSLADEKSSDKNMETILSDNTDFKKIILDVVKSNTELQHQNTELQKKILEVCQINNTVNNNINTINSHNKTFNLQFFLNEQCKDAMNMSEFVNSFELKLEDLESVGELGYVEGITKLFVDKLNSMDVYKRPIHCSDAKREILYIKEDDRWERELRSNPKLRKAIKTISFKNMKLAPLWSDTYPDSKSSESSLNDVYMNIIIQSTGGSGDISISEDKIIKRIAKEIVIEKK